MFEPIAKDAPTPCQRQSEAPPLTPCRCADTLTLGALIALAEAAWGDGR